VTLKGHKQNPAVRPDNPCPKCSSIHVGSQGNRWKCFDCGKNWMKEYKPKKPVTRPEHSCPRCGSVRVRSHGKDWVCIKCGRTWVKNRRRFPIKKADLLRLRDKSQYEIAEILGCSQSAVSLAMKRFGVKAHSHYFGVLRRTPEQQKKINKKISKALKGNTHWRFSHQFPNKQEQKLIRFFDKWNLPFKYVGDGTFKIDGKCPDFKHPTKKLLVEFYGELWHDESDEPERIKFFKDRGWDCLVVWGKEIGWWSVKRKYIGSWERKLYDKILRWMAGLEISRL